MSESDGSYPDCYSVSHKFPKQQSDGSNVSCDSLQHTCNPTRSSKYSKNVTLSSFCEQIAAGDLSNDEYLTGADVGVNCKGSFTLSGCDPPKTAGPLSCHGFANYAPCGHWSNCEKIGCGDKKSFDPCATCCSRSPYGPFGPWSKNGPTMFCSPQKDYIKIVYPRQDRRRNGLGSKPKQPMGKLGPWPLSGSCRYAGKPYGPCRPSGAFKSRGPFGVWNCKTWPESWRPKTPCQPCWMPARKGRRPCTPCYRPLFKPCIADCTNV